MGPVVYWEWSVAKDTPGERWRFCRDQLFTSETPFRTPRLWRVLYCCACWCESVWGPPSVLPYCPFRPSLLSFLSVSSVCWLTHLITSPRVLCVPACWLFHYLPACMPVCLPVCSSIYLPACLFVRLYACLSVCLHVCLFACLLVHLPACVSVCSSVCSSIYLPACMRVCLSVCLLVCLSAGPSVSASVSLYVVFHHNSRSHLGGVSAVCL